MKKNIKKEKLSKSKKISLDDIFKKLTGIDSKKVKVFNHTFKAPEPIGFFKDIQITKSGIEASFVINKNYKGPKKDIINSIRYGIEQGIIQTDFGYKIKKVSKINSKKVGLLEISLLEKNV